MQLEQYDILALTNHTNKANIGTIKQNQCSIKCAISYVCMFILLWYTTHDNECNNCSGQNSFENQGNATEGHTASNIT